MQSEDSNRGAKGNNMTFGSGLSGMVAAYISARALEDDAAHNDNWHAQQAFHAKGSWRRKWLGSRRRGGTAVVS